MYLKVVCAWCGRFLRIKEVEDCYPPNLPITHSVCSQCKRKLEEEILQFFQRIKKSKEKKGDKL